MTAAPLRRPAFWAAVALFVLMRLLPAPPGLSADGWLVAALALLMAMLWIAELLPLALTAALPFLILPLGGVMGPAAVAGLYWSPVLFLVLGGAIVAVAVETHGLHRRLALGIVQRAPASPRGLLFAFMAATALISMLVSNTASALIMMPVALALVGVSAAALADGRPRLGPALVLGIAWSASIGGLGTLVGTPTNAIAAGIIDRALGIEVSFLTWLAFGLPLVVCAIPLAFLVLVALFRVPAAVIARSDIVGVLGEAGPLTPAQARLVPLIGLLLAGWIVWPLVAPLFGLPRIEDGMVAMAVGLLLFIVPAPGGGALLAWPQTVNRLPWDILLLFGGGLALAGAITESGLAAWIGGGMAGLGALAPWVLALVVVGVVVLVTEFASNVASASAFMPVVAAVAESTGVAPLPLVMGAALASSWGFMMPSGTPANAIAFATGRVRIHEMVRGGLWVNLFGIPLIVALSFAAAALL